MECDAFDCGSSDEVQGCDVAALMVRFWSFQKFQIENFLFAEIVQQF